MIEYALWTHFGMGWNSYLCGKFLAQKDFMICRGRLRGWYTGSEGVVVCSLYLYLEEIGSGFID